MTGHIARTELFSLEEIQRIDLFHFVVLNACCANAHVYVGRQIPASTRLPDQSSVQTKVFQIGLHLSARPTVWSVICFELRT